MKQPIKSILKITLLNNKTDLHLKGKASPRWEQYGFGTFLNKVAKGEVAITKEALKQLLGQPERDGLQGMEFWPDFRLSWGSLSKTFTVPLDCINVPQKAKGWIKKYFIVV